LEDAKGVRAPGRVLFLCTGNYYRSRFAELLFNALAVDAGLAWTACSRGLATEWGIRNDGPISAHALAGLAVRGIKVPPSIRPPRQLLVEDLVSADLVIALNEPEHRPLLEERFPDWAERAELWQIHDLDRCPAEVALPEIELQVRVLVERLAR
jgi:protein-tyrosine phosphatase